MATLGSGTHTYEVVDGWGQLPEGIRTGYTHGVVVDQHDRVYIHNQSKDAVLIFEPDGTFVGSWGEQFAGGAHGMFLARENGHEVLYLSDYAQHAVVKTTLDGQEIWRRGVPDLPHVYPTENLYKPTDACVAPSTGDVYVCDGYGESWIHQYTQSGDYLRSWGGKGGEPGKMLCPHGIWVDTRGAEPVLLAADRGNNRLQSFTLDGQHLGFVTEELRQPCCFYQFEGDLVIPDLQSRVTVFDEDNRLITHLGDNPNGWTKEGWPNLPPEEFEVGRFSSPHAACVDSHGDIYVVEWTVNGRITKLARK
ncbi:MAG: hypothetical protein HYU66_24595 [Armatimonadetes bacterium]|nr:hypothetical protein [Armatimonadota bacterium]